MRMPGGYRLRYWKSDLEDTVVTEHQTVNHLPTSPRAYPIPSAAPGYPYRVEVAAEDADGQVIEGSEVERPWDFPFTVAPVPQKPPWCSSMLVMRSKWAGPHHGKQRLRVHPPGIRGDVERHLPGEDRSTEPAHHDARVC